MAETGQVETQAPQSMHVPSSTPAFPSSCNAMAPTGQTPAHAPQPMHVSLSTFAGIVSSSFMLPIISWLLFFNNKFYRRSGLAVDHDIHKCRNAEQLQTDRRHEAARDRDRLDRLVYRAGADRIDFDPIVLF